LKDTGNVLFEAQEFPKAILKCMFSKSWHPFVCPRCTVNVRTGWYIAACWLRLKQYNLVKYNCDLAMKFDAYNVEVRYTGALAMLNLEMGNDARLDLEVALVLKGARRTEAHRGARREARGEGARIIDARRTFTQKCFQINTKAQF